MAVFTAWNPAFILLFTPTFFGLIYASGMLPSATDS